jgi:xylulose-5-phosphate/fructose-6-phosphate phosphoketolase
MLLRVPNLDVRCTNVKQAVRDKRIEHKQYVRKYGEDMPEVRDWRWGQPAAVRGATGGDTAADNG